MTYRFEAIIFGKTKLGVTYQDRVVIESEDEEQAYRAVKAWIDINEKMYEADGHTIMGTRLTSTTKHEENSDDKALES